MTWLWVVVIVIAVVFAAALLVQGYLESGANPGTPVGPDEQYFTEIGTATSADEVTERRLRLVDLARRRVARIGRRPRP
jgi:hypothetical protein